MEQNQIKKFAAFIMTFERESILLNTIDKIFSQTCPPDKIIIVDNSITTQTKEVIENLNQPNVVYYKVGYNSGPAGAAAIGLKLLSDEGYEWIYWGDDDDPPIFEDTFEILLKTANSVPNCGCVGSVGQYFNVKTGLIKRVPNEEITGEGAIEVDIIAGGMSKIVYGPMVKKHGIIPDEGLFFSFEDLDIDLKIKQAGYKILTDKSLYLRHRLHFNRTNVSKNRNKKKTNQTLIRDYYSMRNILIILKKNKLHLAFTITVLRFFYKMIIGFKHGLKYGIANSKIVIKAVKHFVGGKKGMVLIKV